jgi:hypothetical protein
MGQSNYTFLDNCDILAETDKAVFVRVRFNDGESENIWFPRSQMVDHEDLGVGMKDVTITITEWIAKQKGIEV